MNYSGQDEAAGSRRTFLKRGALAGAALLLAGSRGLKGDPLGVAPGIQLYTVGADLKKDVPGTLAALAKIGYRYVETAGIAPLSAKEFRSALDGAGLKCPSAHLRFGNEDPGPLLEEANALGVHYAVSSVLVAKPMGTSMAEAIKSLSQLTADDFKKTADLANQLGRRAKQAGLQYAYHNHNFEFKKVDGEVTGYELLQKGTDPELVKFEADCGWMSAAGMDPVALFQRYPDRFRMIHVKDFLKGPATTDLMGAERPKGTELGRGFVDYKRIFAAAKSAGIQYYFSEQEPPFTDMPAMDAARADYEYLHALTV